MEQQWLLIITDFSHTYINKFIKTYLPIFVSVTIQHEFLNNFSHFISRQWHISFLEKFMKFIVTNVSVAVEIFVERKKKEPKKQKKIEQKRLEINFWDYYIKKNIITSQACLIAIFFHHLEYKDVWKGNVYFN